MIPLLAEFSSFSILVSLTFPGSDALAYRILDSMEIILTEAMSPTAARAARESKDFILVYYSINNNLTLI
jgi:hypothetical protein